MTRTLAFLLGVAITGVSTLFFSVIRQDPSHDEATEHWRKRAYEAERQLASLRSRLESVSIQLESLSTRLESLPPPPTETAIPTPEQTAPLPDPPLSPRTSFDPTPPDLTRQEEWNALVAGTLQAEVQQRLGRTLSLEQEQRLVDTLARLRDASLELGEETIDPEDPLSLSAHLMRTIVLLEADRSFRNELGISVSDFLQGLSKDQIEEVSPVEPASNPSP